MLQTVGIGILIAGLYLLIGMIVAAGICLYEDSYDPDSIKVVIAVWPLAVLFIGLALIFDVCVKLVLKILSGLKK